MIKLSELLEKLYNHEWLSDKEFELYLELIDLLKKKETEAKYEKSK